MATEHPYKALGKLHGPTRGSHTGGIVNGHEIKEYSDRRKQGANYPFEMASARRYEGRVSPSRETSATDQIGV
jgi:hypothetical protein